MEVQSKNECPVPKGTLVVIGGKESKDGKPGEQAQVSNASPMEILETVVKLCNKKDPQIEIITTASSVGEELYKEYAEVFRKFGVKRTRHIHHSTRNDVLKQDMTDRIKEADLFFFTGGDQLKLTSLYGGTEFLLQLKNRYIYDTIVVAGTSAGAMAMSTPMIYAGKDQDHNRAGVPEGRVY